MRFLLFENLDPQLGPFLTAMGHEAVHINPDGSEYLTDDLTFDLAEQYDALVILDSHDRGDEWIATYREIIMREIRIVRVKMTHHFTADVLFETVRVMMAKFEEWIRYLEETDCHLITISHRGTKVNGTRREGVSDLLSRSVARSAQRAATVHSEIDPTSQAIC